MNAPCTQRGTGLIEVLVTLVIIALGLVGVVGLQARMQLSEMEAFQRSQALLLLNDMASRISVNRSNAAVYVTGTVDPLGGMDALPDERRDTGRRGCLRMVLRAERRGRSERRQHGRRDARRSRLRGGSAEQRIPDHRSRGKG